MASLFNSTPAATYKDLLTVASATQNQGLETSLKRIFDGEGVGSQLYLSTTTVEVGTRDDSADFEVHGTITAAEYSFRFGNNSPTSLLAANSSGALVVQGPIETKSSVTFKQAGGEDLVMDAANGAMKRGDGTKGNVKLGDDNVKLQKGNTDLLTALEDGRIQLRNISSGSEPTPGVGDLAIIDGQLRIGV